MSDIQLSPITQTILAAKREKGLSLPDLEQVIDRDEVWIAAIIYRQAKASDEEASKLLHAVGLGDELVPKLQTISVE